MCKKWPAICKEIQTGFGKLPNQYKQDWQNPEYDQFWKNIQKTGILDTFNILKCPLFTWVSPAKFIGGPEFISSKLAQAFIYSISIIERSKSWKFQLNCSFCSDFMAFRIFQGMLNFFGYADFLSFGKQLSEILKFTKPWKIFP